MMENQLLNIHESGKNYLNYTANLRAVIHHYLKTMTMNMTYATLYMTFKPLF